jgi:hypothetical protein
MDFKDRKKLLAIEALAKLFFCVILNEVKDLNRL